MSRLHWALVGFAMTAVGACQAFGGLGGLQFRGKTSSGAAGGGGSTGKGGSAGNGSTPTAGGGGTAGSPGASISTASATASSSSGGTGLDPDLDLPDPGGTPCTSYGNEGECPSLQVCRISGKHAGRCEGCTTCGNLNAPCAMGTDCDIVFECYKNRCTNFCILGTSQCGPPQNCIDVGNDTDGVCLPQ